MVGRQAPYLPEVAFITRPGRKHRADYGARRTLFEPLTPRAGPPLHASIGHGHTATTSTSSTAHSRAWCSAGTSAGNGLPARSQDETQAHDARDAGQAVDAASWPTAAREHGGTVPSGNARPRGCPARSLGRTERSRCFTSDILGAQTARVVLNMDMQVFNRLAQ